MKMREKRGEEYSTKKGQDGVHVRYIYLVVVVDAYNVEQSPLTGVLDVHVGDSLGHLDLRSRSEGVEYQ